MILGKMNFFASLDTDPSTEEQEKPGEVTFDLEPPPPKIKNFSEAINSLQDVQTFLDSKGYSSEATTVASALDLVVSLKCKSLASARQTKLDEYF